MLGKQSVLTSLPTALDPQIHQRERDGIRILDLRGPLTTGNSAAILRTAIVALVEARVMNIILNFQRVTEIDADGLGALAFCYVRVVHSGGALKVLHPSRLHIDLMARAQLQPVLEMFTHERDAVNSFFGPRRNSRIE
jgi:anti-anti-sigma factor